MRLMNLQVENLQNSRINVFTDKQATSNLPLIFLNGKMLKEIQQHCF